MFAAIAAWNEYRKYKEIRVLARGSFGTAVLLQCPTSGDLVVSKQIYSHALDPPTLAAVESEVSILSVLSHPNVIQYIGSYHSQEGLHGGALCILMAYAGGGTLERAISRQQKEEKAPFDANLVLTWAAQLAAAVAHVHERRVLHRDLKSANVFLSESRDVRLGDFGLSRSFGATASLASTVCGTPYYLAPEQVNGLAYGTPADLWSLGVILFELIALRRPFEGPNLAALAMRISSARPSLGDAQLREVAGSHAPELIGLVCRNSGLLALDSGQRLNLPALVATLVPLCEGLPVSRLLDAAADAAERATAANAAADAAAYAASQSASLAASTLEEGDEEDVLGYLLSSNALPPAGPSGAPAGGQHPTPVSSLGASCSASFTRGALNSSLSASTVAGSFIKRSQATELARAAASGDVDSVRAILVAGVEVNSRDYDLRSALHLASSEGWLGVVRLLCEDFSADVSPVDRWGGSPLDDAIRSGHEGVMRYLRSKGAQRGGPMRAATESEPEESRGVVLLEGGHVELLSESGAWKRHVLMSPLSEERWKAWDVSGTWPYVATIGLARKNYDRGPMAREFGVTWRALAVTDGDEPTFADEVSKFKYRIVGGVRLPFFGSQSAWETLRNGFAPTHLDTFVCGYFRNGRTLVQLMALLLLAEAEAEASNSELVDLDMATPYVLEFAFTKARLTLEKLEERPRRDRVFKTALPPSALPCKLPTQPPQRDESAAAVVRLPAEVRCVHVMRDPRDAAVSAFEFWAITLKPAWTFSEFLRFYTRGQLCFQRRLEHDLAWWATAQSHPSQVLWLCYEDLVREPLAGLRSLANLLEVSVSDAAYARVSATVTMEESKRRYLSHEGMKMMLRSGECGRYKDFFSKSDLEFFDAEVLQPLRAAGVPLVLN